MDDPTPTTPQTAESTALPADLFAKAQAAATEKGRPIYVYRAERAGRFTSKWEPIEGASPAAVIEPLRAVEPPLSIGQTPEATAAAAAPAADGVAAADSPRDAPARAPRHGDRVTLYAAAGQPAEWQGVSDVEVEDAGRIVRFCDTDGTIIRVVVGGGSVVVVSG